MNTPAKVLPTVRSLSALFWCVVDEIVLYGCGPLFIEVTLGAIRNSQDGFVFTGSVHHAYLLFYLFICFVIPDETS